MSDHPIISTPSTQPRPVRSFFRGLITQLGMIAFVLVLTAVLTVIGGMNVIATSQQIELEVGDFSPRTINAPRSLTYISQVLTQDLIDQTVSEIEIYTDPDRLIGRTQTGLARAVFNFIEVVRADTEADLGTKLGYLEAITAAEIGPEEGEVILSLSQSDFNAAKNRSLEILSEIMAQEILAGDVQSARNSVRSELGFDLTPEQEIMVESLTQAFIVQNVFLDEVATETARNEAVQSVDSVQQVYQEGQAIIRTGDRVEPYHLEALDRFGLLRQGFDWYRLGAAGISAFLTSLMLVIYWLRFTPKVGRRRLYMTIWGTLVALFMVLARFLLAIELPFLFPMIAFTILICAVLDTRLAIVTTLVLSVFSGFVAGGSLELATYYATGGILAGLTLRDTQRFYAFFRAGFVGAIGSLAVILLFNLGPTTDIQTLSLELASSLLNGIVLSPVLTIAGFFLVGLFGVTTVVQLQDLSRLDHPLLQELLRQAPGTYHHSIMVANLAEQAAERIHANSTLVRVGSFYHDIGKMNRPAFFTENQEGANPHDSLDPYTSAQIILSHVIDGLEMARRYRLPQRIRDFIAEHHGTRVITGFFEKAKAVAGDQADEVDMSRFQYNGPRPQSRETALVLLADTVEAASTAVRPETGKEIEKLVNALIDDHLRDGQLDDSDLTMGDLQIIRESFTNTIKGRFHVRVKYRGNDRFSDDQKPTPIVRPHPASSQPPIRIEQDEPA